ncbi:hypothetical protein Rhal01_02533 [Rubritalea halochordaticola]|uniref:DUF4131 domain-containing protein n=1 Tax=Rubritalea halochordaticola TaxID=714537 RepID=A0ABP9V150_9BACT
MNPKQKKYLTIILIANLCLITWLVIQQMNRPELEDFIADWEDNHYISDDSIRQRINSAPVIILTRNEIHGNKVTGTITEILKHDESVLLNIKVGDDFKHITKEVRPNHSVPDGSIAFYTGSPASFEQSWAFYDERLPIGKNLTLDRIRKLIQEENR